VSSSILDSPSSNLRKRRIYENVQVSFVDQSGILITHSSYYVPIIMPPKEKYTDPKLRDEVKEEIHDGDKGGAPGQWSARKAQMMAAE
jgi:hypothetical protein